MYKFPKSFIKLTANSCVFALLQSTCIVFNTKILKQSHHSICRLKYMLYDPVCKHFSSAFCHLGLEFAKLFCCSCEYGKLEHTEDRTHYC